MHFSNLFAVAQVLSTGLVAAGPLFKRQSAGSMAQGACLAEPFYSGGSGRALIDNGTTSGSMTVELCASYCSAYTYYGVEYGSECYCGNVLQAGSAIESDNTNCNAVCSGNSAELCGGSAHMNLYLSPQSSSASSSSTASSTSSAASTSTAISSSTSSSASTVVATSTASSSTVTPVSTTTTAAATTTTAAATTTTAAATTLSTTSSTLSTATTAAATTLSTVTSSTSTSVTKSSTSTAATATSTFFSLSSCPSFQAKLSDWNLPFVFTPYYSGSGFTENTANPGNLVPSLLPAHTYTISGNYNACQAVQQCLNSMDNLALAYLSFDLHYLTTSNSWQCTAYAGGNILSSFFNVPNTAVSHAYGFNGILKL